MWLTKVDISNQMFQFMKISLPSENCLSLGNLTNGNIKYSHKPTNGRYPLNTVARDVCDKGFMRLGSFRRYCQPSGIWNETTPKCLDEISEV